MAAALCCVVLFLGLNSVIRDVQGIAVANNIYESFQPLSCTQFKAILDKCSDNMRRRYIEEQQWTVFAPNDTAFANLPPDRRAALTSMTMAESEEYIKAFTLPKVLQTTQFDDERPEQSRASANTKLFLKQRVRKEGNSASGQAGPTEYYANGARVLKQNVPAGRSIIHVIDRVLEVPSAKSLLGYISLSGQPDTDFYHKVLDFITMNQHYTSTVEPLSTSQRITAFVPTREALAKIPADKLALLVGNSDNLNEVAQMHIIPDQVVYTSFVYHNEGMNSMGKGQIVFRTNTQREAVFVSSGGVTAQVVRGNLTCMNGALHFIDTLLGYKYNTAKDEIQLSPLTQTFEAMLLRSRDSIQQSIVASLGVTVFVATNEAFNNIPAFNSLGSNIPLINDVMELSMLEQGQEVELTTVNGDYQARRTLVSQHYRRQIYVYSQGNETWIESGYVKARVVRPDIAVTNGFVHFIDAVPGVPSRDVPNTIFCEDWLIKSSQALWVTGLNDYMRDVRITTVAPCTSSGGVRSSANVYTAFSNPGGQTSQTSESQGRACGNNCDFTIFIPNGTAIDNFENSVTGRQIQGDLQRWTNVLKRHITRQRIYLDQTAVGVERSFTALNGDTVRYRRATQNYAYLYFGRAQARVIHSDLGGTNGVIHILDRVIYVENDLSWTSNAGVRIAATPTVFSALLVVFLRIFVL